MSTWVRRMGAVPAGHPPVLEVPCCPLEASIHGVPARSQQIAQWVPLKPPKLGSTSGTFFLALGSQPARLALLKRKLLGHHFQV